jgi:hypothetical protein
VLHYSFQAIVIFNADQHEEAFPRIRKLAAACPNDDTLACRVVEVSVLIKPRSRIFILIFLNFTHQAYPRVQLGINASNGARHDEAADEFTAAVNSCTFSSNLNIHLIYEDLVVVCYDVIDCAFNAQPRAFSALRLGPEVLVATRTPEALRRISSGR